MHPMDERERIFDGMTRAGKAQPLQFLLRDLSDDFPGIESRHDVMGGAACIVRTRIPFGYWNKREGSG
jgi:hypothetical protein